MSVSVMVQVIQDLNYAAVESKQPVIMWVKVQSDRDRRVICRITAAPEFMYEYKIEAEITNKELVIDKPELKMDHSFFRQELIEAKEGEFKVEILDAENPEKMLGFKNISMHLQPYLHWDGQRYAYTLPAFMQPNDPNVVSVLKKAGEYAIEHRTLMSGYQSGSPQNVRMQAECIYRALQDEGIHYISSPPSFEATGQKVRIPHEVLHEQVKQGTCLDLALLYASCLEAVSLHPLIIVIPGHAFTGVWQSENTGLSSSLVMRESLIQEDKTRILEDMLFIECTAFTDEGGISFQDACSMAENKMSQLSYIQDVHRAREYGIHPIFAYTEKPICEKKKTTEEEGLSKQEKERLNQLKKQAMNITMNSKLLNGKKDRFDIMFPLKTELFLKYGYSDESLDMQMKQYSVGQGMKESELGERLQGLRMNDREKKRETGKRSLYLAVNELQWINKKEEVYKAPLYLCPGEIYIDKRGEYLLRVDLEGIRFNPVLKEMLIQDYNIDITDMQNHPENNYGRQMELLTYRIAKQKNWQVIENQARVGIYTIPDEAIWEGLSNRELIRHEIVRGILQRNMFWENQLNQEPAEEDSIYAFPSDSSQGEIIDSAFKRRAQVIIGPAGNGKSQTIANIMTEAVRRNEKVLFVSEKLSALEVERDMLQQIGLEKFCLEIVEGKHTASDISRQILKTLNYLDQYEPERDDWAEQEVQYKKRHRIAGESIRKLYDLMSERGKCGKSLEELINLHEKYSGVKGTLKLDEEAGEQDIDEAEDLIKTLAEIMKYWRGAENYSQYLNLQKKGDIRCEEAVDTVLKMGSVLEENVKRLENQLGFLIEEGEKEKIKVLCAYASILYQVPEFNQPFEKVFQLTQGGHEEQRKEILKKLDNWEKYKTGGVLKFLQKVCENELKDALTPFMSNNEFRNFKHLPGREARRSCILELDLREYGQDDLEKGVDVKNKEKYIGLLEKLTNMNRPESEILRMKEKTQEIAEGQAHDLKVEAGALIKSMRSYQEAQNSAEELVVEDIQGFQRDNPEKMKLVLFKEWKQSGRGSVTLNNYQDLKKKAKAYGMENVVVQIKDAVEQKYIKPEEIEDIFRKSWCEYNICKLYSECLELREAGGIEYSLSIEKYRKNEEAARNAIRKNLIQLQVERLPHIEEGTVGMPEVGRLNKLARQKSKAEPIRRFFEEAPGYLSQIFPCMLMNPAAVAAYVPWDFPQFDMVIIDEGSQMPTYKALLAIAHGKRCFVFGDEKQLTPTRFFKRTQEDEEGYASSVDSILEDAITTSMPRKLLKFHYRSKQESLIAFSNQKYYNGEIITVPSSDTCPSKGVFYTYVPEGCYDRGGKATNRPEAEKVIEEIEKIYETLHEDTGETVGVITFNLGQKDLIQSLLLQKIAEKTKTAQRLDELVSVVNLEACQGKEWDYVILSTGYGPDKEGNFSVNLGALNQGEGVNRLNVMLTRAKKEMYIVSSIRPEMLAQSEKQGVKDLRDFLAYARGDIRYDTREVKPLKGQGGLTERIAEAIRKQGYEVHINIGSSKCKVDIGIVSKKNPQVYSMGILLDHFKEANRRIRDREIIFPEILKAKGWKLYRIHTVNWYENAEAELEQIRERIEKAEGYDVREEGKHNI